MYWRLYPRAAEFCKSLWQSAAGWQPVAMALRATMKTRVRVGVNLSCI